MSAALSWLNDLIQWLGRWIPRLVLIHPTHRGVRFGPSGRAVAVGPGLIVYWPITHDLIEVPVTRQSLQLCGQTLPMADDHAALIPRVTVCTLNLQFSISDPVKAATRILNFHAVVANRAQALAAAYWMRAADKNGTGWLLNAARDLALEMEEYGIDLTALDVAGLGTGVILKNISDWSYSDNSNGKRPE
jgi:hypothetical protein